MILVCFMSEEEKQITLHEFSGQSLRLGLEDASYSFGFATGFVIEVEERYYLVSNYHVFSGKNAKTQAAMSRSGTYPTQVKIFHHKKGSVGDFVERTESLLGPDGLPRFRHLPPVSGSGNYVPDVALLPLTQLEDVQINPLKYKSLNLRHNDIFPSQLASIVGFPFGLTSEAYFPIWKSGVLAMEMHLSFQGLPCFLIDAATRGGMSGSPVYAYIEPFRNSSGTMYAPVPQFLGVYSGRLEIPELALKELQRDSLSEIEQLGSDLGMVWKWETIDEILSLFDVSERK